MYLTSLLINVLTRWHKSTDRTSALMLSELKFEIHACIVDLG